MAWDGANDVLIVQTVDSVDQSIINFTAVSPAALPVLSYSTKLAEFLDLDPFFTVGEKRVLLDSNTPAIQNISDITVDYTITPNNIIDLDQSSEDLLLLPYSTVAAPAATVPSVSYITNTFTFVPLDPKSTLGVSTAGTGGQSGSTRIQYWT